MPRYNAEPPRLEVGTSGFVPASAALAELLAAARENARYILRATLVIALGTASLALVLPRYYESWTRILIDPRGLQLLDRDPTPRATAGDQGIWIVESEMRALTADSVLRVVVEREHLAADPEFNGQADLMSRGYDYFRAFLKAMAGQRQPPTPPELTALRYLQSAIKVRREPQSYVMDLSVTTRDPERSRALADLVAEVYVQTRFQVTGTAVKRATEAMSGRLEALKQMSLDAENQVERFKTDHRIVGASGRLVNEQQLGELNSLLIAARGETMRAAVLSDQVGRMKLAGTVPDSLPEALKSETLVRLRDQYAAVRRREAAFPPSLPPTHAARRLVQQELADMRRLISEEIARFAEKAKLDTERAKASERMLEQQLEELKGLASSTSEKLVKLRQLEREAEAARMVYSEVLTRSRQLAVQTGIDSALASVLSPAILPRGPQPPTLPGLLLFGTLGGLAFSLWQARRHYRADPHVRGDQQLASITGERNILVVPKLASVLQATGTARMNGKIPVFMMREPDAPASQALARLPAELNGRSTDDAHVLLVTAAGDYQGKSMVAVNSALAAAAAGDRVLLIDADPRGRMVSKLVEKGDERPGFLEVAAGTVKPEAAIARAQGYPFDILTAGNVNGRRAGNLGQTIAMLASDYDLVVIDGGVLANDRRLTQIGAAATDIALVARDGLTLKADYRNALDILDRSSKVRPVFLTDA